MLQPVSVARLQMKRAGRLSAARHGVLAKAEGCVYVGYLMRSRFRLVVRSLVIHWFLLLLA